MQRKDGVTSSKGYATYTYIQLRKVEKLIDKLQNTNFVKKYFNKESINLLKDVKKTLERSIKKEKELGILKEDSKFSKPVENIIKKNKTLDKEINKGDNINFVSKREQNYGNQKKRGRGRPRKVL